MISIMKILSASKQNNSLVYFIQALPIINSTTTFAIRRFILILTMAAFVAFLSACGNGDDVANSVDVDADDDGLIEITTAQQLNQIRYNLSGSSFKTSAAGSGNAAGCGNGNDIAGCNGYELGANISLADYPNWVPIGSCPNIDMVARACLPNSALFNGIFEGNGFTISNLTITSVGSDNINGSGLFGAISPTSVLRNVHIRSANINGGVNLVGMLVGYAKGASIMSSSAEGTINASGFNVGGLVGLGYQTRITSSYAVSGVGGVGSAVSNSQTPNSDASNSDDSNSDDSNNDEDPVGVGSDATITSSYPLSEGISGTANVGGLVGNGYQASITSSYAVIVHVRGSIGVGGLVGLGAQARITSSYAVSGSVSGNRDVGGLVGDGRDSTIRSSYAVSGVGGGGESGPVSDSGPVASRDSATSVGISGNNSVGGLVGAGEGSTITSSYAAVGPVSGDSNFGGLVGAGEGSTISYSYWDNETTGIGAGSFGSPKTTRELEMPTNFDNNIYTTWAADRCADGRQTWNLGESNEYPFITCTPALPFGFGAGSDNSIDGDGGDGGDGGGGVAPPAPDDDNDTIADGEDVDADGDGLIEIATAQQFNQIRYNLSGNDLKANAGGIGDATGCGNDNDITACNGYELAANISLADYPNWVPIGSCPNIDMVALACVPNSALFNGIFEGNGFTISNLTITSVGSDNINGSGLFGAISPTSILRNVHIRSANITGGVNLVGMLVGAAKGASIMSSSAEGTINASGFVVGGLVGFGVDATITSSYAVGGPVSGTDSVGGLVGSGSDATITLSYAVGGPVSGTDSVGGLVGSGSDATITLSYAVGGPVSGDNSVGGLVGSGFNITITSSYAAAPGGDSSAAGGFVSGNISVGGLVGDGEGSTIRYSYAVGGPVSGTDSVGGLVGSGFNATITSSYAAGGFVSGTDSVGGLVGSGFDANITSSYAAGGPVSGTNFVGGLVGFGNSADITYSYWDMNTTDIDVGIFGLPKTTDALQGPIGADGIYLEWANDVCDDGREVWDFGTAFQYPALNCTPGGLDIQRIQ